MKNWTVTIVVAWQWIVFFVIPGLIVLLSSIATGLSPYPRAQSVLRQIVDLLSILSHKDSPNTFKPLLARSGIPAGRLDLADTLDPEKEAKN